jgi:twitching motility two-component system response regulator PilG
VARQPEILVVDDSLAVRNYLRSLLESRGYAVTEADSGEAAVQTAGAGQFDCVLMDVIMPGVDGYEACRRIRAGARRGAPITPIVMLTSRSSPFDQIRGKMVGCAAYLTKPVDSAELQAVLARFTQADKTAGRIGPGAAPARPSLMAAT